MSVTRYELRLPLVALSPLHIGGEEEVVDRSLLEQDGTERKVTAQHFARDGAGRAFLSGRSVKGAIRAACSRATGQRFESLWGGEDHASVVTVHPVFLPVTDGAAPMEGDSPEAAVFGLRTRPGIAVDRYWGAVGDGALFEHEVLPAGKELELRVDVHVNSDSGVGEQSEVEAFLRTIALLFERGEVFFGKRRSAGWGRVGRSSGSASLRRCVIDSPDGLLSWLSDERGEDVTDLLSGVGDDLVPVSSVLEFRLTWSSPTGVLVADVKRHAELYKKREEAARSGGDAAEREPISMEQWRDKENGDLIVPGSSIRGALRSRASRIARTVLLSSSDAMHCVDDDWAAVDVHEQFAGDPTLIHDLFGSTERRGAVRVHDVKGQASRGSKCQTVTHNAGDRWTGGVKDSALYSEKYYPDVDWNEIVIEVDTDFLVKRTFADGFAGTGPDVSPAVLGRRRASIILLGLVLAELATGTIPLGSRGMRGMGQVAVESLSVKGPEEFVSSREWRASGGGQVVAQQILDWLRGLNDQIDGGWAAFLTAGNGVPQSGSWKEEA